MTIARQNTAASLPISIHDSESVDIGSLWKLVRLGALQLHGFWWHTKAYVTILGVMLLTLVSLIFLSMHWFYRRLFPFISQYGSVRLNSLSKSIFFNADASLARLVEKRLAANYCNRAASRREERQGTEGRQGENT